LNASGTISSDHNTNQEMHGYLSSGVDTKDKDLEGLFVALDH